MNKRSRELVFAAFVAVCVGACSKTDAPVEAPGADTVFTNGRIYTVDADRSWAEAVAISDGRIAYDGSTAIHGALS